MTQNVLEIKDIQKKIPLLNSQVGKYLIEKAFHLG